mmetsp:Transcript_23331/g.49478  ORF Transcript_23331/g.49478 Transcript_23331/m.49478 type:complete len:93 (-) Transcript_23331:856-1134(-)
MRRQRRNALPTPNVPQLHGFVETPADEQVTLRVEFAREDEVGMSPKFNEGITRRASGDVPKSERFVIAGCGEIGGCRRECDVVYATVMTDEC